MAHNHDLVMFTRREFSLDGVHAACTLSSSAGMTASQQGDTDMISGRRLEGGYNGCRFPRNSQGQLALREMNGSIIHRDFFRHRCDDPAANGLYESLIIRMTGGFDD